MILVERSSFLSWFPFPKTRTKTVITEETILSKKKKDFPLLDLDEDYLGAEEPHGLTEQELTDLGLMNKCRAYCAEEELNLDSLLS